MQCREAAGRCPSLHENGVGHDDNISTTFYLIDILKVMQDLKETSLHSVDILRHFVVRHI